MTLIIDNSLLFSGDRNSIFRLPFKNKFNLTKSPSVEESQQSASTVKTPMFSQSNREQDFATFQKNENIRRMIHETLKSKNSSSMPDLAREKAADASTHNERSVDRPTTMQPRKTIDNPEAHKTTVDLSNKTSPIDEVVFEVVQKKVKFEEINEIEETLYETKFENEVGESSTDEVLMDRDINRNEDISPSVSFSDTSKFDYDDDEVDEVKATPPAFEKVRFAPQAIIAEPVKPDLVAPTPMKRKSPVDSFNKNTVEAQRIEVIEADSPDFFAEVDYASHREVKRQPEVVIEEVEPISQILSTVTTGLEVEQPSVAEPPSVKPRTKNIIENSFVVVEERKDEELSKAQQELTLSESLNSYENLQKLKEKFADSSSSSSMEEESEEEINQHVEVKVVPKSILKTSETSGMQKSITFQNMPQSIRYDETSSSESEDEDVWSRMNQHRYNLTRNNEERKNSPPPLPKTPPPSTEEEKQFSFA